jgi:hypothetical protein
MQKQKRNKPWKEYPIGTKALSSSGVYWEKTKSGWKCDTGSTFPIPGGADAFFVLLPQRQHTEYKCKQPCQKSGCMFCDGGLFACRVCGLTEGCLTTHCPGYQCFKEMNQDIYEGRIDFRDGSLINKCSPHSPVYYKTEEYKQLHGGKNGPTKA